MPGWDHIFQGGIIYFRGGSYILGGGGSDIFGGVDVFQRGSDIAEGIP